MIRHFPRFFKTPFLLLFLGFLGLSSCQESLEIEKDLSYPARFSHSGFELGPSSYYVVDSSGFRMITDPGRLAEFDARILESSEGFFLSEAPFEIVLLSDSTVKVSVYGFQNPDSTLSAETSYRVEGNHLFIEYQEEDVFELVRNDDFDELQLLAYSELHVAFSPAFQERKVSALTTSTEVIRDYPDFILELNRNRGFTSVGDTVAVNRSFFLYDLEVQ